MIWQWFAKKRGCVFYFDTCALLFGLRPIAFRKILQIRTYPCEVGSQCGQLPRDSLLVVTWTSQKTWLFCSVVFWEPLVLSYCWRSKMQLSPGLSMWLVLSWRVVWHLTNCINYNSLVWHLRVVSIPKSCGIRKMGPRKCAQTNLGILESPILWQPWDYPGYNFCRPQICQRSWGQRANVDSPDKNQHQGGNHVVSLYFAVFSKSVSKLYVFKVCLTLLIIAWAWDFTADHTSRVGQRFRIPPQNCKVNGHRNGWMKDQFKFIGSQ